MVNQSGYEFKKGKSRSKSLQGADCEAPSKCCKNSESLRIKRISELHDDIKDYSDRLRFKEKRRQQATDSRNYKLCDQLTEEMAELKQKKREKESELKQSSLIHASKKSLSKHANRPSLFDFVSSSESSPDEMISDSEVSADVSSLASTPHASDLPLPALPVIVDLTTKSDSAASNDASGSSNETTAVSNDTTALRNDSTATSNDTTASSNETTAISNDTTALRNDATATSNDTTTLPLVSNSSPQSEEPRFW